MAVPKEKPINSLEDIQGRTDRAHFCGGKKVLISISFMTSEFLGGTYENFFSTSTNALVKNIYNLAKQEKYG